MPEDGVAPSYYLVLLTELRVLRSDAITCYAFCFPKRPSCRIIELQTNKSADRFASADIEYLTVKFTARFSFL